MMQQSHHRLFCRRFWLWNGVMVAFVFLGGGFLYTVFFTDILRVNAVAIGGSDIVSKQSVRSAAIAEGMKNFPFRFLFGPDTIVFWYLREKEIEGLSRELPLIANVNVAVDLFKEKKVTLSVKEKDIAGVWCENADSCFAFDKEGILFAPIPKPEGILLLLVEDTYERSLALGQKIVSEEKWFKNITDVIEHITQSGVPIAKIKINAPAFREWGAVLPSGLNIYFSFDFVPENFNSVFKNLMERLAVSKLTYLDFRVPNRVYYK